MITIFKNITDSKNPHYTNIETIVNRIKTGKSIELIEKIRQIQDKKERDKLKAQLPSICFSGKFSKRANDSCLQHSGLLAIDFDHLFDVNDFKQSIIKDKYTHCAFISPSGDGLKVIVKIPANIETHKASCRALKEYYNNSNLDNFEDIARVCYESVDNEIFFNNESEIFTDLIEEKLIEKKITENVNDSFEIFEKLKVWIEKTETYCDGNKHKFLVKFAGALNRYGVNQHEAANYLKITYKNAASFVDSNDFDKIVNRVYSTYSNNHNISFFDKTGISYEKITGQRTNKEFYNEYKIENETKEVSSKKVKKDKNEILDKLIKKATINLNSVPLQLPAYLLIRKSKSDSKLVRLMTASNISVIKGKAKSKKTFFLSMICAPLLSSTTLSNLIVPNLIDNQNFIIYFDTEQSEYDTWRVGSRILKLSNQNDNNFAIFKTRGFSAKRNSFLLKGLVEKLQNKIAIIIIDQIADFVNSVNDEKEAIKVVKLLENIGVKYNIHFCCGIHENPDSNTTKPTGWLGTQLMKKAETIIEVKKDNFDSFISHVSAPFTRGEEFENFSFKINEFGEPEIIESYNFINDIV